MDKTQYIHYGSTQFHTIQPIVNRPLYAKPFGGFWASATNAEYGWKDWCEDENFHVESLKESFTFTLSDDAKIIHLYSSAQLDELPQLQPMPGLENMRNMWALLDFEALEKEYDGIELHLSEEQFNVGAIDYFDTGLYYKLYGWDCDSILIFHDHVVIPD